MLAILHSRKSRRWWPDHHDRDPLEEQKLAKRWEEGAEEGPTILRMLGRREEGPAVVVIHIHVGLSIGGGGSESCREEDDEPEP